MARSSLPAFSQGSSHAICSPAEGQSMHTIWSQQCNSMCNSRAANELEQRLAPQGTPLYGCRTWLWAAVFMLLPHSHYPMG